MKKLIGTLLISAITTISMAQAWEKNDISVDVYYGYVGPGLILRAIDELSGDNIAGEAYNPKTTVIGPVGLRAQYMVANKFGIGLDVNYETKTGTWNEGISEYNTITGFYDYSNYAASYSVTKLKVMLRTSWEFVNTDKFTMNWANSIGYKAGTRTLDAGGSDNLGIDLSGSVSPIAFRTALGARYFITDNINIHADGGFFGGGWITGGISYKL